MIIQAEDLILWSVFDDDIIDDAFEKASFGGNRSEAGRYAANIRWQGQRGESKPSVNLSDDQLKAIAKINEATEYVKLKGFTVDKFNGSNYGKSEELRNAFGEQAEIVRKKNTSSYLNEMKSEPKRKNYDSLKAYRKAYGEWEKKYELEGRARSGRMLIAEILQTTNHEPMELSSEEASMYADVYVLRDSKGLVAAVGKAFTSTISTGETTMLIEFIGSAQILKGAGSALWGAMVKSHAEANGYSIGFDVADDAHPFWSNMGLKIQTYGARNASASLLNVKDYAKELK